MLKLFDNNQAENRIKDLREKIERYNYFYYTKNESLVSDVEFDKILKELEKLEEENPHLKKENSPSENVGAINLKESKFKKVIHKKPMLSLSNSYNIEDVIAFGERVNKNLENRYSNLEYILELKLDGASISIQYENGVLVKGVTRGDGIEGEDVTDNILAIESIPNYLKEKVDLEVRGEIVLPISQFKKLNESRLENGEDIFANPRNAASGTLRQLDANIVKERGLDAYFYFLVDAEKYDMKTHKESLEYLEKLGLKTTGIAEEITCMDVMKNRIDYWEKEKEKLDYETDGLVLKLNDISLWEEVGYTTKSPRWAIAYKFPAKQVTTLLKDITWQVGRTGKVTPVAELEEVELSGSKVKRASLHNIDEIIRKDIRIGDRVFIEKAAEIIPQVVSSVKDLRTGEEKEVIAPKDCPICNHKLEKEEGLVDLKCVNEDCPAIIQGTIEYFVSRDGMNISGFGSKIVEKMLALNYIKNISDIYKLHEHKEELITLDKMGEKSVEKLLLSIEKSKSRPYGKTLYALGIPFVGKFLGNLLSKKSENINNLEKMTKEELLSIDGVGEKVAESVYSFFRNEKSLNIVNKLKKIGINFSIENKKEEESERKVNENLFGKTFLFTGKLLKFKREEIKDLIESLGGVNSSSVNKKLNYLIVGEDAGSKLKKAQELGTVNILTEDEFIQMIK
ncbi:NAD-dependent DNA ligase LigA [uncultured Cetobacterium sp.]|uniref:NAD-dependent DNA ligase LigA n=1 Tax=uncultured Cetobacterium sp. TaxID=527638 RepID=UPI002636540E|nr:NAD-dependent DNA ligase LigA [uncultured Cetobacterium sp.]